MRPAYLLYSLRRQRSKFLRTGRLGFACLLLLPSLSLMADVAHSAMGVTKVVAGGDATPIGGMFATTGTPALSPGTSNPTDVNSLAFLGHVIGGSAQRGIFLLKEKTIVKVAAIGDTTPLGGTYAILSPPTQNQAGEVAFSAKIEDGEAAQGVFLFANGQLSTVTKLGKGASLREGADYPVIPALNNRGEVAFRALLPDEAAETPGIFVAEGGNVQTVATDNALTPSGTRLTLTTDSTSPLTLNDAGSTAFVAGFKENRQKFGIFVASKVGELKHIASTGDPTPLGGTFASFVPPHLNNSGDVVFGAGVSGGAAPEGLFLYAKGEITKLVASGDGTPLGEQFSLTIGMQPPPILNDHGQVAFKAGLVEEGTQAYHSGLFVFSQGNVAQAIVAGDTSPLGGIFQGLVSFQLSSSGTVLFLSTVDTDNDGNTDNQGIFAVQPADFLPVSPSLGSFADNTPSQLAPKNIETQQADTPSLQTAGSPAPPPSLPLSSNQGVFYHSCPDDYYEASTGAAALYDIKPPVVLCMRKPAMATASPLPPGAGQHDLEGYSHSQSPRASKPTSPQIPLPPGMFATTGRCPSGSEEVPNGADRYGAKVSLPGFRGGSKLFDFPLTVCQDSSQNK